MSNYIYTYHHYIPMNPPILSPYLPANSPLKYPCTRPPRCQWLEIPTASAAPSKADKFGARPDLGSAGNPYIIMTYLYYIYKYV